MLISLNVSAGSASVSITADAPATYVAPMGVILEATGLTGFNVSEGGDPVRDPSFHDITYIWTVRGQPLSAFSAPQNMVTGWNNPNVMYGKKAAFCLTEPGTTYTVDLWCVDSAGTTATAEISFTTLTEAQVNSRYTGNQTVCFSTSGTFTGAPAGAKQVTVSVPSDIRNESLSLSNPTRFMFRAGEDFSDVRMDVGSNCEIVTSFGAGAKPILRGDGTNAIFFGATHDNRWAGLDLRGTWDPVTETASGSNSGAFTMNTATGTGAMTIHDCAFSGFSSVNMAIGSSAVDGTSMVMADTVITDWQDYGVFAEPRSGNKSLAIIGCRIAQNVDAKNGGPKDGTHNTHGPIRLARIQNTVFAQNDLFSRCGWTTIGSIQADQPCLRLNSSAGDNQCNATIDRCVMEGGFQIIGLEGQNAAEAEYAGNYLFDRLLLCSTAAQTAKLMRIEYGGTTVRNVLAVIPNVTSNYTSGFPLSGVFQDAVDISTSENQAAPVSIYNCTFLNLRDNTNDVGDTFVVRNGSFFTTYNDDNNVLHGPNLDTPVNADAPIDTTTAVGGFTPRYKGYWVEGDGAIDTSKASPATIPIGRPTTGSAAIDGATTGLTAYDDFELTVRTAPKDRGAVEAA